MSDPMKAKGIIVVDDWVDESVLGAWRFLTWEDLVSVVREGVESGTIEGEVVETDLFGTYLVIGPVSDEGEDDEPDTYVSELGTVRRTYPPVSDGGSET